jgi:hypothetical protein
MVSVSTPQSSQKTGVSSLIEGNGGSSFIGWKNELTPIVPLIEGNGGSSFIGWKNELTPVFPPDPELELFLRQSRFDEIAIE